MPTLVVDASAALTWVLPENDSELAEGLLDRGAALCAPAFVFVALANALWFQMRAGSRTHRRPPAACAVGAPRRPSSGTARSRWLPPWSWRTVAVLPNQSGAVRRGATTKLVLPGPKHLERLVPRVLRSRRLENRPSSACSAR